MRVLIAHNRYVPTGPSGENIVVEHETELLRERGVDVELFVRSSEEIASMGPLRKLVLAGSPIYSSSSRRQLVDVLRRRRPDVLHLHNPFPLLSPWVIRTAHDLGIPVVQTVHNFRHACISGNHFREESACHDCVDRLVPWPAVVHGCYRSSRAQTVPMAASTVLHRSTWRSVDRFLALSPVIAEHLRHWGIPADRVTVKPNAVPDPGPSRQAGEGLLFAGRLVPEKGLSLLLQAWQRHAVGSIGTLRILGDGPMRPLVCALAEERADVRWLGRVPTQDVAAQIGRAAAVVVPSIWDEPYGLVAVEALAVGRPALVTDRGNLPAVVGSPDEGAGWIVAPTVDAMAALLPTVHAEAHQRWVSARNRYEALFAPDAVMRSLIDVYEAVTGSPRSRGDRRPVPAVHH